jgi:transposase
VSPPVYLPGHCIAKSPRIIVLVIQKGYLVAMRKYPLELRGRAVLRYRQCNPKPAISELARQFDVHPEALRRWIRQDEADRGERHDRPSRETMVENSQLKRATQELWAVNEVLRAAIAYFAPEMLHDPETVMNFLDKQGFSASTALRALGIPFSRYYDWQALGLAPQRRLADAGSAQTIGDPMAHQVRRGLRPAAGQLETYLTAACR